jgi:phosphatidate phosphatase APP1
MEEMIMLSRRLFLSVPLALALVGLDHSAAAADPAWIDFFGGWASQNSGQIYARVHEGKPPPMDFVGEDSGEKIVHTLEQLNVHAIRDAEVEIKIEGVAKPLLAKTDRDGFVNVTLPAGLKGPLQKVTISLPATKHHVAAKAEQSIPVWNDAAGQIALLSDIDDTLTDTDVPHKVKAGIHTLMHSMYDVKCFPGEGAVLSSVVGAGQPTRPLFFLSGSPWNLHTRIAGAFALAGLPKGAFVLRRFSKEPENAYDFKHPHLQQIFAAFPNTKFVLTGDSGEKDPEVYAQMRKERPSQIAHIYIHNVTHENPKDARFADMTVFDQWPSIAADLKKRGLELPSNPPKPH